MSRQNICLHCRSYFAVYDFCPTAYEIMYCSEECRTKDMDSYKEEKEIESRFDILDL